MRPDELFVFLHPDYRSDLVLHSELFLEFMFWMVVLALTFILIKTKPAFLQRIEKFGKRLSYRRGLSVFLTIVTVMVARALLLPWLPIPVPFVHDEFSYLFQASTFASGHVTNPTPAGWAYFETFHINMRPSYHSMYPPAQAMFMAAAQVLHAHPWWGVWLSTALMCGAMCWMLQGWVSPPWALLGSLLCLVRFGTYSYWMNTYFGGSVAAMGAALVIGSLPRLKHQLKPRYGLIFALGLGLLANSRPYEGLVFSIPFLFAALFWLLQDRIKIPRKALVTAPAFALLTVIVAGMLYYNWRCTGHALLFPYTLNQQTYHITKPFVWQERYPIPNYNHHVMRVFYVFHEMQDYYSRGIPGFYPQFLRQRFQVYYDFYMWPLFVLIFIAGWQMMKRPKWRIFPITVLLVLASLMIVLWPPEPHYPAPLVGVFLIMTIYGFRLAWTWQPKGWLVGPMFVRSVAIILVLWSFVPLVQKALDPFDIAQNSVEHETWVPSSLERARIQAQMEQTPGRHIVFMHFHHWETGAVFWIFNDPDPQTSKVIWAYDMGDEANHQLMQLYPGRSSWFVDKGIQNITAVPYALSGQHIDPLISSYRSGEFHGQ